MKLKIKAKREEVIEVDVEFPIYRKHDIDLDRGSSIYYTRIEADGTHYTIHVSDDDEYEFKIEKFSPIGSDVRFTTADNPDYLLGRGEYESSEAEFNRAVRAAMANLRRFPGAGEAEELTRLREENEKLSAALKEKEKRFVAADAERRALLAVREDVKRDVFLLGIGFTMHTPAGTQRLAPQSVSFKKPGD